MKKNLITSAIAVIALTIVLGIAYPLAMTGVAQVAFPNRADGSPITVNGKVVGSRLLAQAYQVPVLDAAGKPKKDAAGKPVTQPDPKYFQPRPSQTGYNPNGTFFSNRGPNQAAAKFFYRGQLAGYLALEGRYDPGLKAADVPQDAVTTSASGVDPHISPANAAIQAHRIAAVRKLPLSRVRALIKANTDGRSLGFLGEPGVNVTSLNLALDREAR
jgi:K+-transporting ATPase ATPase C chain